MRVTLAYEMDKRSSIETNPLAIERVELIERDLRAWAAKPITFEFDPSGTHLFSMMELTHSYAKRCADFADSIRSLLSENRIVPATVTARALIETIAMACLYLHDMTSLIAAGDRDRVDARFSRFYAGVKGQDVEPVHVMDGMRYLEKIDGDYVTYLDQKYGFFTRLLEELKAAGEKVEAKTAREMLSAMKNYDLLSEVSHPNGIGTQFLYPDESNENSTVAQAREQFRFVSLTAIWQCHHLLNALDESADLPDRYQAAFMGGA